MIQKIDFNVSAESSDDDSIIKPSPLIVEKQVRSRRKASSSTARSASSRSGPSSEDIHIAIAYFHANRYHLTPSQEAHYQHLLSLKKAASSQAAITEPRSTRHSMSWADTNYQNSSWKKHQVQRDASSNTAQIYEEHHQRMAEKSKAKKERASQDNGAVSTQGTSTEAHNRDQTGDESKSNRRKRDWLKGKLFSRDDGVVR